MSIEQDFIHLSFHFLSVLEYPSLCHIFQYHVKEVIKPLQNTTKLPLTLIYYKDRYFSLRSKYQNRCIYLILQGGGFLLTFIYSFSVIYYVLFEYVLIFRLFELSCFQIITQFIKSDMRDINSNIFHQVINKKLTKHN